MLLKVLKSTQHSGLTLCASHTRQTFLSLELPRQIPTQILECLVLTHIFELARFFDDAFGLGKQTELAYAFVGQ